MTTYDMNSDPFVVDGLIRLTAEAFGRTGFAQGMDEVVHVLIHRRSNTFGHGHMISGGKIIHKGRTDDEDFTYDALHLWLDECRRLAYRKGLGSWTTAEVHVFPNGSGRLDLFDEEHLEKDKFGNWPPGGHPAGARTWAQQLLAFPRTVDNIPQWMWDALSAEGITPPVYNPELKTVDWDNKRLPVADSGTDFSVDPVIIDPSKEPGFFSRIGAKLFGN